MPYQPTVNFKLSDGRDLGSLGWITKEYLMSVYPQIAAQMITPELWSWGRNDYGQLGDNTSGNNKSTPVTTFAGGANWKQVSGAALGSHTAAIKTDGTLWVWGANNGYQIGDNSPFNRQLPVTTFAGGTNWKQVACGQGHTSAIKTDGTLWIWGWGGNGRLGLNNTTQRLTPVTTFAGGTNWKQVSCGWQHTAAIKTDGTLWIWGYNGYGNLGDNTTTNRLTPVTTFAGGTNWKQVACGGGHTAAIKTDGTLWTWGRNYVGGPLGDNTTTDRPTPGTTFAGGTNWKQVSCGRWHTAAIKTDGTLWTWGYNYFGQVGNNVRSDAFTERNALTPVTTFAGGTSWKQVSCGTHFTGSIKTDGTLWVWGQNSNAQLGINIATADRLSPVTTFAGGTNWKQVACGGYNTTAIKTSDDLQGI